MSCQLQFIRCWCFSMRINTVVTKKFQNIPNIKYKNTLLVNSVILSGNRRGGGRNWDFSLLRRLVGVFILFSLFLTTHKTKIDQKKFFKPWGLINLNLSGYKYDNMYPNYTSFRYFWSNTRIRDSRLMFACFKAHRGYYGPQTAILKSLSKTWTNNNWLLN